MVVETEGGEPVGDDVVAVGLAGEVGAHDLARPGSARLCRCGMSRGFEK